MLSPILGTWTSDFTISAGAALDAPDAAGGKLAPTSSSGHAIDGKDGKAPLPKFSLSAYNGGPMRLAGYHFPVVIEASGVKFATPQLPIYVAHLPENAGGQEMMETLVGGGECGIEGGKISAAGDVTGTSKTVGLMLDHAKNGFKFQTSIHGLPVEMSHIPAGQTATVNGRPVQGPANVARQSVIDHIAILPLGADTTTSARIAASHAAGDTTMEFAAWLKANYSMDQAAFDALPEFGRNTIKAAFDTQAQGADPTKGKPSDKPEDKPVIAASGVVADTAATIKAQNEALAANMDRVAKIGEMAKDFPAISAQAIREGWGVEKTENAVLKAQRDALTKSSFSGNGGQYSINTNTALPEFKACSSLSAEQGGRHIGEGNDALARVVEAKALLSCGYSGDRLVKDGGYGEAVVNYAADQRFTRKFGRSLGPVGIIKMAAAFAGVELPDRSNISDFFGVLRAEFSSLQLNVILSNVMNKFILESWNAVDPDQADPAHGIAWQKFVKRLPVNDLKPNYFVRLAGDMRFQDLGPAGEIQHGKLGEQSYKLQATTKAIMLGISREQIINDDLSALSSVPQQFGRGSGLTVAQAIYDALQANAYAAYQSDGSTAFFTASDITTAGNNMKANALTAAGNALSIAGMDAAVAQMDNQTDPFGQPAGVYGEILLVPTGLKQTAVAMYNSPNLIPAILYTSGTTKGQPGVNTYMGMYKPVCSAYLAVATTWYLLTGPQQQANAIAAGFLNGQEMPIVERGELDFDRLGINFRGFQDFGVSMMEPRAAIKSAIA